MVMEPNAEQEPHNEAADRFDSWIDRYQAGDITYAEAIEGYVGEMLTLYTEPEE